jgi:hypothetical protein
MGWLEKDWDGNKIRRSEVEKIGDSAILEEQSVDDKRLIKSGVKHGNIKIQNKCRQGWDNKITDPSFGKNRSVHRM